MFQDEDYDSETSDEDFVPEGVESDDEPGSEEEEEEVEHDNDEAKSKGKVKKKKTAKKKKNPLLAHFEKGGLTSPTNEDEKEAIVETEEKDKEKAENLWADFLADVDDKPSPPPKPKSSSWASLLGNKKSTSSSSTVLAKAQVAIAKREDKKEEKVGISNTVKITKVFEFAGEEVRVEKEVDANSDEAKLALASPTKSDSEAGDKGTKRSGGLSSIMGLIDNKKQKLSTLEKTKLDWSSFKSAEGIDEELESHKKSKHGYLDKKAFLERADLRQFEIERSMRMSKRSNR